VLHADQQRFCPALCRSSHLLSELFLNSCAPLPLRLQLGVCSRVAVIGLVGLRRWATNGLRTRAETG
jgi:hypothetical protein